MNNFALKSNTSLRRAVERLSQAVTTLERVTETHPKETGTEQVADLDAARAESEKLRETHALIAERLDATIARLRDVLDR